MSNLTVNLNSNSSSSTKNNSSVKLLVFEIGKLTLALPILQVQKVVKQSEVQGSGLSYVNLAHLNDGEIAVVDLHQKLFGVSLNAAEVGEYFMITKEVKGEPLGITVAKPPSLIDQPLTQIRLLPNSYRRADTLEIASHVTVVSEDERSTTIFILDLEKLI